MKSRRTKKLCHFLGHPVYCSNHLLEVLRVLLDRNFVSDLPTLKPKNLIFLSKKPRFLPALTTYCRELNYFSYNIAFLS